MLVAEIDRIGLGTYVLLTDLNVAHIQSCPHDRYTVDSTVSIDIMAGRLCDANKGR